MFFSTERPYPRNPFCVTGKIHLDPMEEEKRDNPFSQ
jgi:hypothetical protein